MIALERLPRSEPFTLLGPIRPPASLIRVTLEADEDFSVSPNFSIGVDVVNQAGKDAAPGEGVSRLWRD